MNAKTIEMENQIKDGSQSQDWEVLVFKGILHLWEDECVFKMGHLCRRNVK